MKQKLLLICIVLIGIGCKNKKQIPDVSGIQIFLKTERFEKDFFAVDTLHPDAALQALSTAHPGFTQDYLFNILGTSPDSAAKDVPAFIRSYESMAKLAGQKFKDFSNIEAQVKHGLQFVHYYFPGYKLPVKLVTFIGPINSYGNIITTDALAIGLKSTTVKD